jgi:hypothetical protein
MKMSPLSPFIAQASLRLLMCLVLLATNALAEAPDAASPPERKPKLLKRIGSFFYNAANRLERSDAPASDQPGASNPEPPVPAKPIKGGKTGGAARKRPTAPVNPDPRLLQPKKSSSTKTPNVLPTDGSSRPGHRPTPPPDSLKPDSAPPKSAPPSPDADASGKNQNPAESPAAAPPAADAPSQPKETENAPVVARPEKIIYPVATPTKRLGRVKSPYPPNSELNVTGLNPGSLARDPVSGKIFRLP